MRELIYKDEAYKAIDNCIRDSWDRISPADAKMNISYLISDANELDRAHGDVDAVAIFMREMHNLEQGYITTDEFDERIEPLRHLCYGRPQGEWIEVYDSLISCKCSVCGWESHMHEDDVYGMPYCPNCGAMMKGVNDETD